MVAPWYCGRLAPPAGAIPEVPWVAQAWRMGFQAWPTTSNFDPPKIPPFGEIVPKTKVGRRHGRAVWGVARWEGCANQGALVRSGWGWAPPPIRPFPIDWHPVWPLVLPGWGCSAMVQCGGGGIAAAREEVCLGWRCGWVRGALVAARVAGCRGGPPLLLGVCAGSAASVPPCLAAYWQKTPTCSTHGLVLYGDFCGSTMGCLWCAPECFLGPLGCFGSVSQLGTQPPPMQQCFFPSFEPSTVHALHCSSEAENFFRLHCGLVWNFLIIWGVPGVCPGPCEFHCAL